MMKPLLNANYMVEGSLHFQILAGNSQQKETLQKGHKLNWAKWALTTNW